MNARRGNIDYVREEPASSSRLDPRPRRAVLASVKRIRCFIDHGQSQMLPRNDGMDGVDFVLDAEDDFDLFIAPMMSNEAFADFLSRCANPAAPMIALRNLPHPRADIVVDDLGSASLASAISSLQPLLARTSALAPLPRGIDRNGLLALALMLTRNCCLAARWQPYFMSLVEYPLLRGIDNARSLLEEMAEAGLIRRRFFQRVQICSSCGSSRLHAREVCVACHSSNLVEQPLIHHYSCAFQGAQPLFEAADGYVCPKCHKQLRHYGVDYDKPGSVISCADCEATLAEPEVGFTCVDCDAYTSGDHATHRDWYHYDLLPDGVAALRCGELPRTGAPGARRRSPSVRDFCAIVEQLLAIAEHHGRPLTLCQIQLNTDALINDIRQRGFLKLCHFVRDLIAENLRPGDVLSITPWGALLCCLPETDRRLAETGCAQLRALVAQNVRIPIDSSVVIIERDNAREFLRELGHVR